jgi:lambda family phage portal protein
MTLTKRIARAWGALLGKPTARRMYEAARPSRTTSGWDSATTSADSEIKSSLTNLRGRSRSLGRNSAYAKRAKAIVVDNVVGAGMGLQAQVESTRAGLRKSVNSAIEEAWTQWSRAQFCHTGGAMCFTDIERGAMSEVFETGEIFLRLHLRPFGGSPIPFALEFIESERVPHEFAPLNMDPNSRMGIEVDDFGRPLAYWIRSTHQVDVSFSGMGAWRVERVPASEILHIRVVERWPQSRGVPWLHATMKSLNDMDGYADAEITAARGAANYMGWQDISDLDDPDVEQQEDGTYQTELAPGIIGRGPPGSEIRFNNPNRPNTALPDFMRYMLRQAAAGIGINYESLSKDFSQSNYSSSRLALLDDRDRWRVLQGWFMQFRQIIHETWLRQAVMAGAIEGLSVEQYAANPQKFAAAKFKARGWGWVDPAKEVDAYKEALKAGFTTRTQIVSISGAGMDIEDVDAERRAELDSQAELDLEYDTDPGADQKAAPAPAAQPDKQQQDEPSDDDMPAGRNVRAIR